MRSSGSVARDCLDAGQRLSEEVSDKLSLALLHCSRAESEHLAGNAPAARAADSNARMLASEVGAEPESELGLALARVAVILNGEENGGLAMQSQPL